MDNPDTLATPRAQYTGRWQKTQRTKQTKNTYHSPPKKTKIKTKQTKRKQKPGVNRCVGKG